nr:hypothetical protein [Deltaproteobacteria bacterium]
LLVRDTVARKHHATLEADRTATTAATVPIGTTAPVTTIAPVTTFDPVTTIAIRGTRVAAVGADRTVSVWDLATTMRIASWGDDDVHEVAWLDEDTLACATEGGLVLLHVGD